MGFMDVIKKKNDEVNFDIKILSEEEKQELDNNINSLIERHKENRQAVNRLVFQSVVAMTASEDYEEELSSRRGLKRFIGSITGSNKALQDKINRNRSVAQYASQQTLQKLAEQNAMSFDLIATVNNKLDASIMAINDRYNKSMKAIEEEFNQVYNYLIKFFKQTRSDMIQLEKRVDRLERNVSLLNWQNSIEYQIFNGVEYSDLDDAAKIICLARDFFEITKGNWTTSDLLLLKTAMSTIGISPKEEGSYFNFIRRVSYDKTLKDKLLGNHQIVRQPDVEYLTILGGIKKLELLGSKEHYIVNSVADQLGKECDETAISERLVESYMVHEAQINVNCNVPYYELILELIYNLRQAEDEILIGNVIEDENDVPLSVKFDKASDLFRTYNPKEALPLLKELSDAGYSEANALLYWLYTDGYYENKQYFNDENLAETYAKKGYDAGDCICTALYVIFCCDKNDEDVLLKAIPAIRELAEQGDMYAEYTLALLYRYGVLGEIDNFSAMKHYIRANSKGFYAAAKAIFNKYYFEQKPFKKDWVQATIWADEVERYNCEKDLYAVAYLYMCIEDYGCSDNEKKEKFYRKAVEIWENLVECGNAGAPTNLGWMYGNGRGVEKSVEKKFYYYSIAAERGDYVGQSNLAYCYEYGTGTEKQLDKAIEWYKKSAEQGYQTAKLALKRLGAEC